MLFLQVLYRFANIHGDRHKNARQYLTSIASVAGKREMFLRRHPLFNPDFTLS
jgi:hypothetical protein